MAKFTTRKVEGMDGTTRICADGIETDFYIERGEDPQWGLHREWFVYKRNHQGEGPLMTVYRRKSDALHAFGLIWDAAQK